MSLSLLHVSDVHFGPKHLPRVAEAVLRLAEEREPDLIVVSGDLTQRAKRRQFRAARAWADRLPAPILAVPGNHDVPLYRVWERVFAPYRAYRRTFDPDLEPVYRAPGLLAVGLNSAHGWTTKHGRLTRRQIRRARRALAQAEPGDVKLVVVHHDLAPPPRFDSRKVTRRARKASEMFSELGVDLVLSGHRHQTYLAWSENFYPTGGTSVPFLHTGTTTSSRGRAGEAGKNTCNWIEIGEGECRVTGLLYDAGPDSFEPFSLIRFPRRGAAFAPEGWGILSSDERLGNHPHGR